MNTDKEISEKAKRIDVINANLNVIKNLATQMNGVSAQLSMIQGNLGGLTKGLTDNINYIVAMNNNLEAENKILKLNLKEMEDKKEVTKK